MGAGRVDCFVVVLAFVPTVAHERLSRRRRRVEPPLTWAITYLAELRLGEAAVAEQRQVHIGRDRVGARVARDELDESPGVRPINL